MESMVKLFDGIYKNKTVLLTGHTGFKGSWMAVWLQMLGAKVIGFSLEPATSPNHFELLDLEAQFIGDIRDKDFVQKVVNSVNPDIVFHLAAQSLVRPSYQDPILTYETNVMGTINLLEATRQNGKVDAFINVTSDKCYENQEWIWGYRENEPMGGYDPYSSSKGCSELLTDSFRNSFFNKDQYGNSHNTLVASARAGNVVGGGDWADSRLIPDIMREASSSRSVEIRSPESIRPWQHVLEPLSGYLQLGHRLLNGEVRFGQAWNFGPDESMNMTVKDVVECSKKYWNKISFKIESNQNHPHEAKFLKLDCSKANMELNWHPTWDKRKTIETTILWYKNYYEKNVLNTSEDIEMFVNDANSKGIAWAK